MGSFRRAATLAVLALTWAEALAGERVVAVGDVHGSIDGLHAILQEAALIDGNGHWVGGNATLVQTGDLLDRGVEARAVLDLMMRLPAEAAVAGGRVVVLLGNHEVMNLLGFLHDVHPEVYASFVDGDSEGRRAAALKATRKFTRARARRLGLDVSTIPEIGEQWLDTHPPGVVEYLDALAPEAVYGAWLRQLPAAVVVGDTLFVHGGFGPMLEGMTVEAVNSKVAEELAAFDRLRILMVGEELGLPWHSALELAAEAAAEIGANDARGSTGWAQDPDRARRARRVRPLLDWEQWLLVHPDGPIWYREAEDWDATADSGGLVSMLDALGVFRMVVGHTPQAGRRITSRFGHRLLQIDTGMLVSAYGGQPSALEISDGTVTAIYVDAREVLDNAADAAPLRTPDRSVVAPPQP